MFIQNSTPFVDGLKEFVKRKQNIEFKLIKHNFEFPLFNCIPKYFNGHTTSKVTVKNYIS